MKSKLLIASLVFFSLTKIVWATDSIPPVITLNGPSTIYHILNTTYIDPGATAFDNVDGNITANIYSNITSSNPDVNLVGNYSYIYYVFDAAGNSSSALRTVIVYNEAEFFQCSNYDGIDSCLISPVVTFVGNLSSSPNQNMHVMIQNFGAFGTGILIDALIGGTTVGSTITVSTQSLGGSASIISGTGMITNLTPLSFYIQYQWTDGFTTDICKDYYTTQCFTSIVENKFDPSIKFFPNPSSGLFTVQASGKYSLNYVIYNLQGQIILSKQVNSNYDTIDLSNQPTGVYFIRFVTENGFATKKILVEH